MKYTIDEDIAIELNELMKKHGPLAVREAVDEVVPEEEREMSDPRWAKATRELRESSSAKLGSEI